MQPLLFQEIMMLAEVKALIEKYFGEIPAGEELADPEPMTVTLAETKKLFHEDDFASAPQYTMVYPVAQQYTKDAYSLDVLAQLLGAGKEITALQGACEGEKAYIKCKVI